MAFTRTPRGGASRCRQRKCSACKRERELDELFSKRGLCEDCGVCNMVAQYMGMTHVYYSIEEVNTGVKLSYTGPIFKVA